MANNILRGSDLNLFVNGKSIAAATNHVLTISSDVETINSKDSGFGLWNYSQIKSLSWTITSENLISTGYEKNDSLADVEMVVVDDKGQGVVQGKDPSKYTYNKLFDLMMAREPLDIVFAVREGVDMNYLYRDEQTEPMEPMEGEGFMGKALITNITFNANCGDTAQMSIELSGCGALKRVEKKN